jgi:putative ATP-binding cassette transporter
LAIIVAMNLGMVYVQVLVNIWIKDFYNVLQSLDKARFMPELFRFCILAAAYIAQSVYMLYLSQMLQIRWRRWLTEEYLKDWLSRQAYYRMQFAEPQTDNPDQRISEDINSFIEITLNLGTTLLSSVATLVSFLAILWQLSGTLGIPLGSPGDSISSRLYGLGRPHLLCSWHLAHHAHRQSIDPSQFQPAAL